MNRYFSYVEWDDVQAYEAAGWMHPDPQVVYPRMMYAYGTTMEWSGEGDPPIPRRENEA